MKLLFERHSAEWSPQTLAASATTSRPTSTLRGGSTTTPTLIATPASPTRLAVQRGAFADPACRAPPRSRDGRGAEASARDRYPEGGRRVRTDTALKVALRDWIAAHNGTLGPEDFDDDTPLISAADHQLASGAGSGAVHRGGDRPPGRRRAAQAGRLPQRECNLRRLRTAAWNGAAEMAVEIASLAGLTWHENGQSSAERAPARSRAAPGPALSVVGGRVGRRGASLSARSSRRGSSPSSDYFHSFPHLVTFPFPWMTKETTWRASQRASRCPMTAAVRLTSTRAGPRRPDPGRLLPLLPALPRQRRSSAPRI